MEKGVYLINHQQIISIAIHRSKHKQPKQRSSSMLDAVSAPVIKALCYNNKIPLLTWTYSQAYVHVDLMLRGLVRVLRVFTGRQIKHWKNIKFTINFNKELTKLSKT